MPDYYPSDMVLAVAEAMHAADNYFVSYDQARAAMNFALEEAALIAEDMWWKKRDNLATAPYAAAEQTADEIAAAIRAMKE